MNYAKYTLAIILVLIFSLLFLLLKPGEPRVIKVPGFEEAEREIKRKYGNKTTFSREELYEMEREIKALHEARFKKYKEIKNSDDGEKQTENK